MSEPISTAEQGPTVDSVLQKINSDPTLPHLTFVEVPGLKLNPPDKQSLLDKYPDPMTAQLITNLYADFIEPPLLEYSKIRGSDAEVHDAEAKVLSKFEQFSPEWNIAYHDILNNNLYRANKLAQINGFTMLADDMELAGQPDRAQLITDIFNSVLRMTNEIQTNAYKESSREVKLDFIRQHCKAAEMVLRVLDGQDVTQEEIAALKKMNKHSELMEFNKADLRPVLFSPKNKPPEKKEEK